MSGCSIASSGPVRMAAMQEQPAVPVPHPDSALGQTVRSMRLNSWAMDCRAARKLRFGANRRYAPPNRAALAHFFEQREDAAREKRWICTGQPNLGRASGRIAR